MIAYKYLTTSQISPCLPLSYAPFTYIYALTITSWERERKGVSESVHPHVFTTMRIPTHHDHIYTRPLLDPFSLTLPLSIYRKKALFTCPNCQFLRYCSKDCERMASDVHKYECPALKRMAPNYPNENVRLLARLIFILRVSFGYCLLGIVGVGYGGLVVGNSVVTMWWCGGMVLW